VDLLIKNHIQGENVAALVMRLAFHGGEPAEKLFRAVIEKSSSREALAWAHFGLARRLKYKSQKPKASAADAKKHLQEAEKHYEELQDSYGDIKPTEALMMELAHHVAEVSAKHGWIWPNGCTLADMARNELFVLRHLAVGSMAPDIQGQDIDGNHFKLSDYRGNVIVLDFWGHW
jgi:hypothetical protein